MTRVTLENAALTVDSGGIADESSLDDSITLPGWARQALIGAGLFGLGGLIAFGYSWRPLHGSLTWKVAALEERLDARNLENLKLSDELARRRSLEAERVDPEAFREAQSSIETAETALAQAKTDLVRAERKRKDANASARTWRKRYEKLLDETSRAPIPAAPAEADAGPPMVPPDESAAPASPETPEPAILDGENGPNRTPP